MATRAIQMTFAGDSQSLERAFDRVGAEAQQMAAKMDKAESEVKSFGSRLDDVGGAVGNAEGKFMGIADLLDGLGGAFGLPTEAATGLFRAFGDMSGGFEVVQGLLTSGVGKLGEFASAVMHSSAVTKAWTGIQAAFNAVMSLNPAVLITGAIIALGAALVVAYQKSETFRNVVHGALDFVRTTAERVAGFFTGLPDRLWGMANAIKDAVTWPFRTAFDAIARLWNSTVGRLSFKTPDWIPGLGGKGFDMPDIPTFHTGGLVGQGLTPGTEVPAMLLAGERVLAPGRAAAGMTVVVNVSGSVIAERDLARTVAAALRTQGARGFAGVAA